MGNYYDDFIPKAGNEPVANALVWNRGTVVSHFQACASSGLYNSMDNIKNSLTQAMKEDPKNVNMASQVTGVNTDQTIEMMAFSQVVEGQNLGTILSQMPVEHQRIFLQNIGGSQSGLGLMASKEIFKINNIVENDDYQSWENPRQADFLEALSQDSDITRLRESWTEGTITNEEKHVLAEKIHNVHASIYGYAAVPIVGYSDLGDDAGDPNNDAYFGNHRIVYNDIIDGKSYMESTPDAFIDTMAHESQHVFQEALMERLYEHEGIEYSLHQEMRGGTSFTAQEYKAFESAIPAALREGLSGGWQPIDADLMKGGALREAAGMFALSSGSYINARRDYEGYQVSPQEADAWNMGGKVTEYLNGSPEEQTQMLTELRTQYADHEIYNVLPEYTDEQLNMTCSDLGKTL